MSFSCYGKEQFIDEVMALLRKQGFLTSGEAKSLRDERDWLASKCKELEASLSRLRLQCDMAEADARAFLSEARRLVRKAYGVSLDKEGA